MKGGIAPPPWARNADEEMPISSGVAHLCPRTPKAGAEDLGHRAGESGVWPLLGVVGVGLPLSNVLVS